jgi:hypothetical protein
MGFVEDIAYSWCIASALASVRGFNPRESLLLYLFRQDTAQSTSCLLSDAIFPEIATGFKLGKWVANLSPRNHAF